MARIRTIKPEFWVDDVMVELTHEARLLFIGLWNFADDEGYIEDKPKRIKMQIFPAESGGVEDSLSALVLSGRLHEYTSEQGALLKVANWELHQKVNRPTPTRFTGIMPQNRRGSVSATDVSVSTHAGREGKGRERKGREMKGASTERSSTPPPKTCKKHSHWDHSDNCRACGNDRRTFEVWETQRLSISKTRALADADLTCEDRGFDHKWLQDGTCAVCPERRRL